MAEEVEEEGDKKPKLGKARSIAKEEGVVLSRKRHLQEQEELLRLRTPITRKAPITRRTTSTRTRRKITSTAEKQGEEL